MLDRRPSIPLFPGQAVAIRTDRSADTVRVRPWSWELGEVAGQDRFGLWADAEIEGGTVRFRGGSRLGASGSGSPKERSRAI